MPDVEVQAVDIEADASKAVDEMTNAELNERECTSLPLTLKSRPLTLYAEVSAYCNMQCRMCGRTVYGVKPSDQGFMGRDVYERLMELCAPGSRMAMFGGGETLMHKDFKYFLKLAAERGMLVSFNTNGRLLTRDIAEAMVEYGQDGLVISCSAGTAETYEIIHRGGRWKELWRNIEGLRSAKVARHGDDPFAKPHTYLEFVAQKDNVHELPTLLRRAWEYGFVGLVVVDLVAHSDEMEAQRVNTPEMQSVAEKYYRHAMKIRRGFGLSPAFTLHLPASRNSVTKELSPVMDEELPEAPEAPEGGQEQAEDEQDYFCLEPWHSFYVRYDGTVGPCCITARRLGNLNEQSAEDIWNGEMFQKFRARMRSKEKPFECLACHAFPGPKRFDPELLGDPENFPPL